MMNECVRVSTNSQYHYISSIMDKNTQKPNSKQPIMKLDLNRPTSYRPITASDTSRSSTPTPRQTQAIRVTNQEGNSFRRKSFSIAHLYLSPASLSRTPSASLRRTPVSTETACESSEVSKSTTASQTSDVESSDEEAFVTYVQQRTPRRKSRTLKHWLSYKNLVTFSFLCVCPISCSVQNSWNDFLFIYATVLRSTCVTVCLIYDGLNI